MTLAGADEAGHGRHGRRWSGPDVRGLLAIFLLALGMRAVLSLVASLAAGTGALAYARSADGYQYLAFARAWFGDPAEFYAHPSYGRLFPGYALLVAVLTQVGVAVPVAALAPSWIASGLAAAFTPAVFGDRKIGWAMAVLTPSFVYSGSLMCTEAVCLALSLTGVIVARKGRVATAGVLFGLAAWFRPVAVFAMLGCVAATLFHGSREGRWRRALLLSACAGLALGVMLIALQLRFGDALMTVRGNSAAYGGELLTWPFHSIVRTPLTSPVATWKLVFVAAHLFAALWGCVLAVRQWRSASARDGWVASLAAVWLVGNTVYVLCIGDVWGFHDFPRFLIPALPPLFWAWRRFLPRQVLLWILIGLVSLALAFVPARRRLLEEKGRTIAFNVVTPLESSPR